MREPERSWEGQRPLRDDDGNDNDEGLGRAGAAHR
jgi:hypothetical protein